MPRGIQPPPCMQAPNLTRKTAPPLYEVSGLLITLLFVIFMFLYLSFVFLYFPPVFVSAPMQGVSSRERDQRGGFAAIQEMRLHGSA